MGSRRTRRVSFGWWGALAGLVVSMVASRAEAQGDGDIAIFCVRAGWGDRHFEAVRAFLNDPETRAFLEEQVKGGAIWHIGAGYPQTGQEGEIFVSSAGRKRNTNRVLVSSFHGKFDVFQGRYNYASTGHRFSRRDRGGVPVAKSLHDIEILRDALNDASLRQILLDSFRIRDEDVYSVCIEESRIDGRLQIMFYAPPVPGGGDPFSLRWEVRFEDSRWRFEYQE